MKLSERKDVYRMLKAEWRLENIDLNGTGIPPCTPTFVNQSLCRYYKLWMNNKSVKVTTHIDYLKILFPGNAILEEN